MSETASVKISIEAKRVLDLLHKKLNLKGIKITQKKIMDILIENTDVDQIKNLIQNEENTALLILGKPAKWGIKDSSEDIDKYLYGEENEHTN